MESIVKASYQHMQSGGSWATDAHTVPFLLPEEGTKFRYG